MKATILDEIDIIFSNNTVMLTKYMDNGKEVVDYDTVAISIYNCKKSMIDYTNKLCREVKQDTLNDYTRFLCDCSYTDDDVWSEKPTAVDRYLSEKKHYENS